MVGGAGHALQICQVFLKQRYYFETLSLSYDAYLYYISYLNNFFIIYKENL